MKKKILIIFPLLIAGFLTSCNNDPETKPVTNKEFVNQLNEVKKQADTIKNESGVKYSIEESITTDLTFNGTNLKLISSASNETVVNKNKAYNKTKLLAKGETVSEGKKEKVDTLTTSTLWEEYANDQVKLMLDVNSKTLSTDANANYNKKIMTTLTSIINEEEFNNFIDDLKEDYGSFSKEQIDDILESLKEYPLANLGYVQEGETQVFSIDQDNSLNKLVNKTHILFRFDGYLLTKAEASLINTFTDENGNLQQMNIKASIKAEKYDKEITLPSEKDYEVLDFEELESYIPEM